MIQQSCLSRTEEAGDDGGGDTVIERNVVRGREHSSEIREMGILGISGKRVEGSEELKYRRIIVEKMPVEISG